MRTPQRETSITPIMPIVAVARPSLVASTEMTVGELQSLPPLNNKIAVFGLDLEDTNGNTLFINLGTSDKEKTNTLKALLDDGLDTLQELLEAIPQDSRQLSCEELVPRLRKALGQAKTCGKLEQQIRDLEES